MNISPSYNYCPSNDSIVVPSSTVAAAVAAASNRLPPVAPPRFFLRRDSGRLSVRGCGDGEMKQGIDSSFLREVLMESGSMKEEEKARGLLLREERRRRQGSRRRQQGRGYVMNNDEGQPPTRNSATTSTSGGLDELMARIARRSSQDTFSSPGVPSTTTTTTTTTASTSSRGGGPKDAPGEKEAATTTPERSVSPATIVVDAPAVFSGGSSLPVPHGKRRPLSLSDFIADDYGCDGVGDKRKRSSSHHECDRHGNEWPLLLPGLLPETTYASPSTGGPSEAAEFAVRPRYDSLWLTFISPSSMENHPPKTIEVERGEFK